MVKCSCHGQSNIIHHQFDSSIGSVGSDYISVSLLLQRHAWKYPCWVPVAEESPFLIAPTLLSDSALPFPHTVSLPHIYFSYLLTHLIWGLLLFMNSLSCILCTCSNHLSVPYYYSPVEITPHQRPVCLYTQTYLLYTFPLLSQLYFVKPLAPISSFALHL